MNQWEIWLAKFPFEDRNIVKNRPVIILSVQPLWILSVKVTSKPPRDEDQFDVPIIKWKEAGLDNSSTAREGKTINLSTNDFVHKIGDLDISDRVRIMKAYSDFLANKI